MKFLYDTLRSWNNSADNLLMNSLPPSVWIWAGILNLQNCLWKLYLQLFWHLYLLSVTTVYFIKASVMHNMNFCISAGIIGPLKSAWILTLGRSGVDSGLKGLSIDFFHCWHLRQYLIWIFDVLVDSRPEVCGSYYQVGFLCGIVTPKDSIVGFTYGFLPVLFC